MLVFEFFFLLIALKLYGMQAFIAACVSLFFYMVTIFCQKKASVWSLILVVMVCVIHGHFLAIIKTGCWSFESQFWRAVTQYHHIQAPALMQGTYSVCDMSAFEPIYGMRDQGAQWLTTHHIHPMISYFLFAKADNDFFEKSLLSQLGLVHVLTVSGLHIDVIFRTMSQWVFAYGSLIFMSGLVLIYGHMVGYGIPVQRAIIMGLMGIWGRHYGLSLSTGFRWQCAFLLVLILNPMAFQMSGFYLSFFLSAAIAFMPKSLFSEALFVGVIAVSLWFFNYYPLMGLLMNLLALPLYEMILIVTLCVGYMAYWLDIAMPLEGMSAILRVMDDQLSPFLGVMWIINDSWLILLIFFIAAIVFFCFHRMQLMITALMAYVFHAWVMGAVPYGEFRVKFFSVGHGLMVFIQTASHAWVYDVPSVSAVKRQLGFDLHKHMPYLQGGVTISHSDQDHSGGGAYLLSLHPQMKSYGNLSVDHKGHTCLAGGGWLKDGVEYQWMTVPDLRLSGNAASCVLSVTSQKGFRLLLTGDIEPSWKKYYAPFSVSIASAPHHGRKDEWFNEHLMVGLSLRSDRTRVGGG